MAKVNSEISLIYTTINKIVTYLKVGVEGVINKELFIDIRDTFPLEYKNACLFYNTGNVNNLIKYAKNVIDNEISLVLNDDNKNIISDQYKSLLKTLQESYNNVNYNVILKIINSMDDADKANNRDNLRYIIKSLILLQIITNVNDIIETTLKNDGVYNYITEYNNNLQEKVLEHINEYENSIYNDIQFINEDIRNEFEYLLLNEDDISNDDTSIDNGTFNIAKFYEDDLLKNIDDSLYEDDDENEDNSDFESIINRDRNTSYSSDRLDDFLYNIFLKEIMLVKVIINNIIDSNYDMIPNKRYIMFITIVILMHSINKF